MSYVKNKSRKLQRSTRSSLRTSSTSSSRRNHNEFYELEAAEVIDVIRDSEHPSFDSFEDIGKVKIRMIHSELNKREEALHWAKPMNPNFRGYPMNHEIVIISKYLGNYFYQQRVNFLSNINHNENTWISINLTKYQEENKSKNYEKKAAGNTLNQNIENDPELGNVFVRDNDIKPLKHNEGDIIWEGRFGNSIRFGSNQETHKPYIKIRSGQFKEASQRDYLEPIEEDINKDASSLYISEDQEFPLEPSTRDMQSHYFSVNYSDSEAPKKFDGKQIIANSNRIVLNTKKDQFIVYSKRSTHMLSNKDFTKDIERDFITKVVRDRYHETDRDVTVLTKGNYKEFDRGSRRIYINMDEYHGVGESFVMEVPESFLVTNGETFANSSGSENRESGKEPPSVPSSPGFETEEPYALGWSLADFLKRMIQWIDTHTHPSPVGPTGPPPPTSPGGALKVSVSGSTNQEIDDQINSDNHYLQR